MQNEIDEDRAVSLLIEKEVSQLESSLFSAESLLEEASGSLEKLELATAHVTAANAVLSDQLTESVQHIDSTNEGRNIGIL